MKPSGMLWSDEGAQEVPGLRAAYLDRWWDRPWRSKPLPPAKAA